MHFFSSELLVSKNQEIIHPTLTESGVSLYIKREDLIHEYVSGNKFRKLKYNLLEAKRNGCDTILTFGGAYSNHIAATASAGKLVGLQTIGVIRGDELAKDLDRTLLENDTLRFASINGMKLKFVSRNDYKQKRSEHFLESLKKEFGLFYCIPEGGTNDLAIQGCEEILTSKDEMFDYVCCAVGTGGTISGIINSSLGHQHVIGFPALKGDFLSEEIEKYTSKTNWSLAKDYHFGGYGKINTTLIEFINTFKQEQNIALDPIYTGKMLYGLFDSIQNGAFTKNTRILAIHTGGLQGILGMNKKLSKKKLPLITI
ncbi:1-aminocyclopropane-1-carboxylate deaminase/D-cysteine desulfhydrase [Aquimarina sp. BL5]|uniref:1-aminocyclopropane-1-carboxylate deaminase/D-cysteine desulfhydrase n=1 Tax=Aquimarina sp. BL5 TaxID=1714860 RepID=UPI000E544B5D|nr:pyridoxal-phosphate dependent enzyme [Aquimarina sp. BL5]AXT52754.1 1-aminocyclopropane-1-carboxylate deaminase/D-cysteine desulfhydrase [Aquimarina sp. BL5]RKN09909.1 pyridoxal-phosphate dependent enzyme [Aquimarina sp. BL5]